MAAGVAVPGEKRNAEKAWQVWRYYNGVQAEDPHATGLALYERGYRDCLADMVDFAGLQTAIHRLADLLEANHVERDAVRDIADSELASTWAMSNALAEEHAIAHPDGEVEELPF